MYIDLIGYKVPYIIGITTVRARVIGVTEDDENYVLVQEYDTQDERGVWIHVKKEYYRSKRFINDYWSDLIRQPLQIP